LLDDKVRVPRTGVAILNRGRVSQLIDQAVRLPVTLLTGPAGAGKTVAAAGWAASRPAGRRPAWLTVDAADADPARFFGYLTAALSKAGAVTAEQARSLRELPAAELPFQLATLTGARAEPTVLVLDDVHELSGGPVLSGLEDLVRQAPPGLRLLLSGRRPPGMPLARLRVSGELADIGADDLACTPEEMDGYFAMLGQRPTAAERERVLRWTEGWMAGLRLVALGASAEEAKAQAIVADYMWDEVLAPLPARTRTMLMRTCLTPTVPVELADELASDRGSGRLLDQLSRTNGLVQAVHPESEYRYHPMLRSVLNSVLRRELPDELPGLLRQVARWHAAHGDLLHAEQAAAGTADWDFGVHVLREAGPTALVTADGPELEAVLGSFPADRRSNDTVLAVALAAARLWQGDADGALPHLEAAEAALVKLSGPERGATRLWLTALRVMWQASLPGPEQGSLAPYWSLAAAAHESARTTAEHNALGLLWLALGCAALRDLDAQRARTALLHASSQLSAGGSGGLRERARCWEAVAAAWYGDLAAAGRLLDSVQGGPHGRDRDLAPVLALAAAIGQQARDDPRALAQALDDADLAAESAQSAGEPSIAVLAGLVRTRLAVAEGNLAGARGLVRWLTEAAAGWDAVGQIIAVLDAEIGLAAGELDRARTALTGDVPDRRGRMDAGPPPAARQVRTVRPEVTICRARLLIAEGDEKAALALVEPLITAAGDGATLADRLAALLTTAVARHRLGQAAEAAEQLQEALALAEPDGACGAFVAAGAPVRSLLTVLTSPGGRYSVFAGRILERFETRLPNAHGSPTATPLTESELAVLRFLPSHMTNQEIADSLFLSINTIKTHLSSVYRKLGVLNRRQAIAQGRRLELLLGG
jgi:LuxR family transcriptional regulator, maltose regulon positive regulatory protein